MNEHNATFANIDPVEKNGRILNVIIDTPAGSRNKYSFDPAKGLFKLGGLLAAGHIFPYDFGFLPNTKGEDGDPVDALVLADEPLLVGILVSCRLLGGLKAFQTDKSGTTVRNDRILAVAEDSVVYKKLKTLNQIEDSLLDQIEHFFVSYNEAKGRKFRVEEKMDKKAALAAIMQTTTIGKRK